jgi:hypothetical protein
MEKKYPCRGCRGETKIIRIIYKSDSVLELKKSLIKGINKYDIQLFS